jgi:Domain of unknown function (DUF4129)
MSRVTEPPQGADARPRTRRGPRRGARAEAVLRVGLVLLLLGVSAVGLSGRKHLNWDELAKDPESSWIGLLLVVGATFVVIAAVQALFQMLRVTNEGDDPGVAVRTPLPWYRRLVSMVIVVLAVWAIYAMVRSATTTPPRFRDPGRINQAAPNGRVEPGNLSAHDARGLLIAVLVGAGLAVALAVVRRRAALADRADSEPDDDGDDEQTVLAEAVAAAEVELDAHGDDTRAAIIAAYVAMERQLVASGTTRRASDTPTDFLQRAMTASRVSRGASSRLTDLFREARYSSHPMSSSARDDAARALARVADDLARGPSRSRADEPRGPGG